jgi:pimeloyl-ACP methyl ester carboxylesterase
MATYVLVHGGGHGGWCYAKVKQRLEQAGHQVFAPSLTGLAERSHLRSESINLDTHIQDVVQLLGYWDLDDVILVGHSYGGMVITGIADRASERIGRLVYSMPPTRATASPCWMWPDRSSRPFVLWGPWSTEWNWCCSPGPVPRRSTA